jgi:hypothetical protein
VVRWLFADRCLTRRAFHLFLSHAWPAAQDTLRVVKQRFAEALPSCRVFLDVDEYFCGSTIDEVDRSDCILVRAQIG